MLAVCSCVYPFMVFGIQLGFAMQRKVLNLACNGAINRHDLVSTSFLMWNRFSSFNIILVPAD